MYSSNMLWRDKSSNIICFPQKIKEGAPIVDGGQEVSTASDLFPRVDHEIISVTRAGSSRPSGWFGSIVRFGCTTNLTTTDLSAARRESRKRKNDNFSVVCTITQSSASIRCCQDHLTHPHGGGTSVVDQKLTYT